MLLMDPEKRFAGNAQKLTSTNGNPVFTTEQDQAVGVGVVPYAKDKQRDETKKVFVLKHEK